MATCETCRWWKGAGITASLQNIEVDDLGHAKAMGKALGYCEVCLLPHQGQWKGLVAEDYWCGEHQERDDG